jgi:hypothetical protein
MINTTDRLQLLAQGEALNRATAEAITTALELVARQTVNVERQSSSSVAGFRRLFGDQNRKKGIQFDAAFLDAALQWCLSSSRHSDTESARETFQSYVDSASLPATAWNGVGRGLKLMLVELWRQRALLLPTLFTPGTHFPMQLFDHELLAWIKTFDLGGEPVGERKSNAHRLYFYGPRLLLAADWQRPEDVSLNELGSLHHAQNCYAEGKSDVVIAGGKLLPFSLFAAQLLAAFPGRVRFTVEALAKYSAWSLSKSADKATFEEFSSGPKITRRKERARKERAKRRGVTRASVDHVALVADAARKNTRDAILAVYRELRRGRPTAIDWREVDIPSYPGREHVDLATIAPNWIETFRAFLHHRKHVKEYRSDGETVGSLSLLADYLFFYLPWWKQAFPGGKAVLPASPRAFSRYAFVARHTDVPIQDLPVPLLQLIAMRRPGKHSASVAVHHLTKFFEFVAVHFAEDERVAGRGFASPINDDFDVPRIKKKSKTNKEIIPKQVYGHLLFYCYAIEEFGQHLQELAMQGRLPLERGALRSAQRFVCADFDRIPVFKYRGKEIGLECVPNVFTWAERECRIGVNGGTESVYMPHVTVLRLLIASLETGLRCQSIQWLDRSSWDSLNATAPAESYTYALLVNTDKTRDHAWKTYVVHRVRELLQREQSFQESLADANQYAPVNYEGLEHAPFDPIRPLFRAPNSADPVGDNAYANAWKLLMVDFEDFYRTMTGEEHFRMCRLQPRGDADGTPVVQFLGRNETIPYCPVSILAIHTPHSCRATFATNRQGVLELSDVADLLGHQSEVVTAHYTKPSSQALQERLRESDAAIVAEYSMFDASSEVHIRADRPDSALVRSFSRDREGTLQRFRFMPSIALWSTEDAPEGEEEGLKLLREGPMSRIRFRETHICPVGEECPGNIIEQIGAPRRCGACPLAMKCIDHLPAIAAKKNQLVERIRYLHRRRSAMEKAGEPLAALDEVWDQLELDINELLGWQLSEEILTGLRREGAAGETAGKVLHVDRPEIVRRHLERVTRSCNTTELLLQRIADSNAYPTLSTPEVQAAAARLKRKLLAGRNVDEIESWIDDLEDVRSTAKMLSLMMKTAGLTMAEVAALASASDSAPTEPLLLSRGGHGQ